MRTSGWKAVAVAGFLGIATTGTGLAQEADMEALVEFWRASPHGDATAEAFTHWDDEGEIPPTCATCHSGAGMKVFLEAGGGEPGIIDRPVATGTLVDCDTCHSDEAKALSSVTFPSGAEVANIEKGAVCMVCHQGRESTQSVNMSVADIDADTVDAELAFINVHYGIAAATQGGGEVHGGYEYDGKSYMGRFGHVPPASTCIDCHDPHSTEVALESCTGCHDAETPDAIRMSPVDFDGDGDTSEGIAAEIARLHDVLDEAITAYARNVASAPILYAPNYPYYFADTNGDGVADADETVVPNSYKSWTPRLLKAAYNYHFVREDPGAYAHNPHYALQILYDSIESLGERVEVELAGLSRPE